MHILICETEHFIRHALAEHLSALNYQVSEVENASECLEFVIQTPPDLILLDKYEAIRKLEALNLRIPIIIMHHPGDNAAQLSRYEHVSKPYELAEVSALIKKKF